MEVIALPAKSSVFDLSLVGYTEEVERTVSNLADGLYEVRVHDGLGNVELRQFTVDKHGGPQPEDSSDPLCPKVNGVVTCTKPTGRHDEACVKASKSGHKPVNARINGIAQTPYPRSSDRLCIDWACTQPGTYDISIEFSDDRGNWAQTHKIHCEDSPPTVIACSDTNECRTTPVTPSSILTGTLSVVVTSEESVIAAGAPDACIAIEQLAGGLCLFHGFGGNNSVNWQKDFSPPSYAKAHTLYQPEPGRRYQNYFYDVSVSLNGGDLFSKRYAAHGTAHVDIDVPSLGQPQANCDRSNTACVASPGSGGGGGGGGGSGGNGGGYPPPPPIDSFPPTPAMKDAAANSGMSLLGEAINLGAADRILSRPLAVTHITGIPPFQPTQATKICWWTGTGLVCETPANVACVGTKCTLSSSVIHASTWVFAAPLPAFYPDMTAPSLADINISEDGTAWNAPGGLIRTTDAFVRMTARDPPSGIELISGLTVSSAPLPFASTDPSLILHLHFDEGSGSQLFDSSPLASTSTINFAPVWVPGRFGPALEFTGISGERAAAPVGERFNSGPFSIEAWVYPTDSTGNRRIASKGTGYMQALDFLTVNGRLQASIGDGSSGYTVTSAETLPLNQWSLVAMSFDGAKLRIFADGAQKGEISAAYSSNDSTLVIGALWKGRIDEFRLLTRGLSRSESALDYRRGFAALASVDGGRSWKMASHHDSGAAAEGQPGPAVMSASGFALARSTYSNIIEFEVTDASGNFTSTSLSVPVAPADTTPLVFVDAEISADNGSTWYPLGAIPRPGLADFRVKVKDPALGEALRSGIATSTATLPFSSDASTLLLLHLDEGAGVPLDSSANAFTMLAQNGPTWTSGRFVSAMQFNGDWQFLAISGSPSSLDVPDWTASAWVYPTETFTGGIVSKINDARYGFTFKLTSGRPELNVHNAANGFSGGTTITAPDVLPLNQWTAVTATSDRNVIRIFVNGELKASAPGYMDPNSAPLLIGAGGSGPPFWRGRLDEIRFMSRAQSPEEVLLDYRRGYVALFSSNGGASWTMPTASYGSALQGELDTVMTVSTLTLTDSLTSNRLQIIAADAAGNTASETYVLPSALDAGVPASPVVVSTQLAPNGAVSIAWERGLGEVPVSYSLYRATEPIASLAGLFPVATSTGMSELDAPPPALGDVLYYALTATNLQGRVSAPSVSVQALLDRTPPVTVVDVQGGIAGEPGVVYALPASTLTLSATDQGTAVSGIAAVALTVDGTPVAAATAPFQLPEGPHQLSYYATDLAGNAETPRETTVSVDATAPVSTLTVTGGGTRDSLDRLIIVAGQAVVLTAQDAAVGVDTIFYRLDSGTWTVAGGPVTIPEGQHVLQFYAVDRLGNAEAARSQAFVVALPPLGEVSVVSPTPNSFTVSWSSLTGAAGYVMVVSSAADFGTVAFSTAGETLQVLVDGLQPSTTYFVRVAYFSDTNDSLPVTVTAFTSAPPPVVPLSITSINPSSAITGESVTAGISGTGFDASAALSLERNLISQGTWTATGSFTRGSYHGTLTKLNDGRVLLTGGTDPAVNGSQLTNADLYDPATGAWTAGPPMLHGRFMHASVLMADGRVMVAGSIVWPYDTVEIFDPLLSTWTAAPPLAQGRSMIGAALLPDGRVLAVSGWDGGNLMGKVEIYDPVANTWSPAPAMGTARRFAKMTTLNDGRVLVAGGEGVATAEIYNPITNAWTPAGTMSHSRQLHQVALLPDGKVLATGGWGPVGASSTTDVYDPEANTWTAAAPMSGPRGDHAMVLVNGTPMVIGGRNQLEFLASTEFYDVSSNSWRAGPRLMGTRFLPNAATLADGRVLVAAGYRPSVGLNTAEILNMTSTQIQATGVTVADAEHLSGTYDLTDAATGYWDVVVRESGGRIGRRGAGFHILSVPLPTLVSMSVTPSTASLETGSTAQFEAVGTFTDGSTRTLTGKVAWSTDVSSVATVSVLGLAKATGNGIALVIASSGTITAQAVLTVYAPTLVSIAVTPDSASIAPGTGIQFEAAGTFTDASTRNLTGEVVWSTDLSSVATIGASGLAAGVSGGATRVIASSGSISDYAHLRVLPPALTVTSITPASAVIGTSVSAALVGIGFDASAALSLERNLISQGTWTATGSFTRGSYHGTLTKLNDGRVLLTGGTDPAVNGSQLTNADLYDPATGAWTAGPPMLHGRFMHASVLMADGRVMVAGSIVWPYDTVEIFDPLLSTWTAAPPLAQGRSMIGAALLPDGRVLAVSGWDGGNLMGKVEIYDPVANTWSPAPAMGTARRFAKMTTLNDGRVLVAGGEGVATAEIYNPITNAWTPAGTMSHSRQLHQVALLPDGKVLATGGWGPVGASSTTDVYDPEANTWTAAAPMSGPRGDHAMVLVNGTPMVIGGRNQLEFLASTEFYDVSSNSWRAGPRLMGTRFLPNAATLADGRVLVAAGYRPSVGLNTAEILNMTSTQIQATGVTVADAEHLSGTYDLTDAATGYWDVVVRESGGRIGRRGAGFQVLPPPTLASIAVTPVTATIMPGTTAQFTAAGTFADGSTRTLTGEVAWSTDVSSVASVDENGLATGAASGRASVTAALGGISGQGVLNVAFVTTSTGTVGGSAELTLVSTAPFSVVLASTETGAGAVALGSAATQGLVLVSPVYNVTRQDSGATATLTWSFDPALVDETTLAIWRFDGTAWSSATVLNQVVSVTGDIGTVTGEVVLTSLFGLFTRDVTPPVTTLLVDGLPAGATSLTFVETSAVGFAANDAGVGVRETRYALDGGAETVFVSTLGLSPGTHALSYRSVDRGGNLEAAKYAAVTVLSSDAEPPLVRLDFPGAAPSGIEQALGGVVDVRGTVTDASAVSWTLAAAPGAAAAGGFTAIASGAGSLSGLIAAWNTASLSGYQTLRLSATDASGNAAQATANVFVGAPVMTFAIGRKNSDAIVSNLKGPTGIAVRSDGAIWVASTENDQILLISPAGILLGTAGRAPGHSGEHERGKRDKKGKDHDDEEEDRGERIFKTPQGLALDAAGSLYVADRDLDRVVKLSPDGQTLLLQFGRAGSGPGELRRPFDVAVDANGDVYAADAGNRRVSVFDTSGAFLRQVGAGVFLSTSEIRGLALTSEGLWVSDKELEVIHLFSRSGSLIKTISGADSAVGELSRMRGLASDRLGALYVVEPNRDRVQKFDPRGKGLLAFGTKAGLSLADRKAKRWLTQPIDAAVAPDGSIWVTDKGRDRIVRYALPSADGGLAALSTGGGEFASESAEAARRVVDHKDGASVSRDDGSGVRVPKGALDADLEITVEKGDENVDKEPKEAKRRELKVTAVSDEVQYGPEGTTFNAPVTLTIPYDANLIASQGLREDDLKVYYWSPTLMEWQAMPSTVDKRSKTVNALTNHFSAYQVGALGGIGVAAVDDFGLRDGYAFPNPSRNGSAVTFRMQPGSADSIEVRVYDLSGRKVHSSTDFRFLGAVDDGNGKGAQNTYDHAWNVPGVGSGVYTFVMTAKKAGAADVRKTGKVGVIK